MSASECPYRGEFAPFDFDAPFDVDAYRAQVPEDVQIPVNPLFEYASVLGGEAAKVMEGSGLRLFQRISPRRWDTLSMAMAELTWPGETYLWHRRRLGWAGFDAFSSGLVGRAMLAGLSRDIPNITEAFCVTVTGMVEGGSMTLVDQGQGWLVVELRDLIMHGAAYIGLFEGILKTLAGNGHVLARFDDPWAQIGELLLEWKP